MEKEESPPKISEFVAPSAKPQKARLYSIKPDFSISTSDLKNLLAFFETPSMTQSGPVITKTENASSPLKIPSKNETVRTPDLNKTKLEYSSPKRALLSPKVRHPSAEMPPLEKMSNVVSSPGRPIPALESISAVPHTVVKTAEKQPDEHPEKPVTGSSGIVVKREKNSSGNQTTESRADVTQWLDVVGTVPQLDSLDNDTDDEDEEPNSEDFLKADLFEVGSVYFHNVKQEIEDSNQEQSNCICNNRDNSIDNESWIECDNKACKIGWYHQQCANYIDIDYRKLLQPINGGNGTFKFG